MKRLCLGVFIVALCVFLVVYGQGNWRFRNAQFYIGASEWFTQEEIESAMDVLTDRFIEGFDGANRLVSIRYFRVSCLELERAGRGNENVITLRADYYRGRGFRNDTIQRQMFFTLVRNNPSDSWRVAFWGKF